MHFLLGTQHGSKKELLDGLLELGVSMVHLDARDPDVIVPTAFKNDPHLRLNLSYRFGIEDFELTDEAVLASLSFSGNRFPCTLPWQAIYAMTSDQLDYGYIWPEDMPQEFLGEEQESDQAQEAPPQERRLSLVQPVEQQEEAEEELPPPPQAESRPFLRVVK